MINLENYIVKYTLLRTDKVAVARYTDKPALPSKPENVKI